jgi:hypothetical protein
MFDRQDETTQVEKVRVDNKEKNINQEKKPKNHLYLIVGVLVVVCLVVGGLFISNSNQSSESENETALSETTMPPSKIQEIPFQELIGEYTGNIEGKEITITIFVEGTAKKYSYSENKNSIRVVFHYEKTNQIHFSQPKEGLGEFTVFKEENSIILRSSDNIELKKVK